MTWSIAKTVISAAGTITALALAVYKRLRSRNKRPAADLSDLASLAQPEIRKRFKVAVVDDEVEDRFPSDGRTALLRRGFDVTYLGDIHSINDLAPYKIILCDIRGVGRHLALNADYHGGIIVSELRRFHPLAYIIIYSSYQYGVEFNRYLGLADGTADRGRLTGEYLVDLLERAMRTLDSPSEQWLRFKKYVLGPSEQEIRPHDLERLHTLFLNRFTSGRNVLDQRLNQLSLGAGDPHQASPNADLAIDATEAAIRFIRLLE